MIAPARECAQGQRGSARRFPGAQALGAHRFEPLNPSIDRASRHIEFPRQLDVEGLERGVTIEDRRERMHGLMSVAAVEDYKPTAGDVGYSAGVSSRIAAWLARRLRSEPKPAPPREPAEVVALSQALASLKRSGHRLSEGEVAAIGVGLARLLDASPGHHLRWTAPTQVLFARDGSVRVLFNGEPRFGVEDALEASQRWLSPQLLAGERPTALSDLFNLASLMFAAAALRAPFEGVGDWETRTAIVDRELVTPLRSLRPDLSDSFQALMDTAHQHGAARFTTLQQFLHAAQPLASDLPSVVRRLFEVAAPLQLARAPERSFDPSDRSSRLVEADRLEEQGNVDQAAWLRRGSMGPATQGEKELKKLRKKVGLEFLASTEDSSIRGCVLAFGATCPGRWRTLARTTQPLERTCGVCARVVTYTASPLEAASSVEAGRQVAVDAAALADHEPLGPVPFIGSRTPEKVDRDDFD